MQKPHERINDILLGPLERPALKWLASKMPEFMTPDKLTLLGLFGSFLTGWSYYMTNYDKNYLWLASLGLVINWFGDSLDGTLARYRHIERPRYGFFIDHTLDSISMIFIAFGIGLSPYAQFEFVLMALLSYFLMSILVYIRTYIQGVFRLSYYKIGPTEVRVFIIILNTILYYFGAFPFLWGRRIVTVIDVAAVLLASGLFIIYVASVIIEGQKLKAEEKK
ncbi:CDP-alcohol phosphatidyltransferase family protein [Melioribacter sp. Ez-97]|uniref:CDP-alcohol phosphatidyltransferase family protein n=1 Tax=unclassified Melioribacter TaxID=2627329 RepID=UPI003BE7A08E